MNVTAIEVRAGCWREPIGAVHLDTSVSTGHTGLEDLRSFLEIETCL